MREFLFRGKSTDFGDWLSGYIRQYENGKVTICDVENKRLWFVDPSTVGEFTSLTDKNGKKIFEGDIVRNGDYTMIVVWCDFHAAFMLAFCVDGDYFEAISNSHIYLEVIGNIHDNPELL